MKLRHDFYLQSTLTVAQALLGKQLVFDHRIGQRRGMIVETEAYCGPTDRASHAHRGKTKRTAPMFAGGGISYVYLVYGMYYCLNIVTEAENYPAAVLIRALEPLEPHSTDPRCAAGPGKLTRWLGIDLSQNGIDLTGEILYIEEAVPAVPAAIRATTRVGVDYAGAWAQRPWRFYLTDHPAISKR